MILYIVNKLHISDNTHQPTQHVVVTLLHPARRRHLSLTEVASRVDRCAAARLGHGYENMWFGAPRRNNALSQDVSGGNLHKLPLPYVYMMQELHYLVGYLHVR